MKRLVLLAAALFLATPALADESETSLGFPIWVQQYKEGAIRRGLRPEWLAATLDGVQYLPRVVALDRNQPDDSGRKNIFADYLARQLSQQRIDDGRARATANAAVLKRIAAQTGVPAEIIVAIWGMETSYGRVLGGFDLPSAIATLAYDARREALFTAELDALVRMVGEGRAERSQLKGSWAGAFGQSQFLPSSYLSYAIDGDGDGRVDLWRSSADTFASIGNYLKLNGWQAGVPWGFRATVPTGFDRSTVASQDEPKSCVRPLKVHSRWLPAADWQALGLAPVNAAWPAPATPMALVEPDGPGNGAFLVTRSYRAIMEYNCSNFYALSVALLGDEVAPALK